MCSPPSLGAPGVGGGSCQVGRRWAPDIIYSILTIHIVKDILLELYLNIDEFFDVPSMNLRP